MTDAVPIGEQVRVRPGGLMRCCLATIDRHTITSWVEHGSAGRPKEGDKLTCAYCQSKYGGMRFKNGAWEWDQGSTAT